MSLDSLFEKFVYSIHIKDNENVEYFYNEFNKYSRVLSSPNKELMAKVNSMYEEYNNHKGIPQTENKLKIFTSSPCDVSGKSSNTNSLEGRK
jgi:hypothetical protein